MRRALCASQDEPEKNKIKSKDYKMKKNVNSIVSKTKLLSICLLVLALLPISAYATLVDLGAAADFAILGGSAVTNTGSSVINNGNVGSSPTPAVSGFLPGVVNNGILYTAASSVTAQAHTDLIAAYAVAASATTSGVAPADLGGAILTPGVYTYAAIAPWTAGTLTLDALGDSSAQWIFQIGALTTPGGAAVSLIDGASADNVFWQIGSSLTLGGTKTFAGNILAQTSITLGGGTLDGRALAINGAVTISVAETINIPTPTNIPEPATLCLLGLGALSLVRRKKLA